MKRYIVNRDGELQESAIGHLVRLEDVQLLEAERDEYSNQNGGLRERLQAALSKLDEYEHRAKLHMDRCQHDMERIVRLEQQLADITGKHDIACFTITDLQKERERLREQLDEYSDVLRGLASYVGCGGYNSYGRIAPKVAEEKIRWGIDHLLRVETGRREAAECRLGAYRQHTIQEFEAGGRCRICMGMWSKQRSAELHEDWCPNNAFLVERQGSNPDYVPQIGPGRIRQS